MSREDKVKSRSTVVSILAKDKEITALRTSQAHLAAILEIAHEAIISIDEHQRITLFNRGAEKIFGYTAAEATGQPLNILLPKRLSERHQNHVAHFSQSSDGARLMGERQEIIGRRKNGEEFPAEASISKHNVNETFIFTVVLRDITERRKAETEREKLIGELNTFGHTVSHNLKAPLQLILGYATLLDVQAKLPDSLQTYLHAILQNGRKMQNMIEELQVLAGVRKADVALKPLNMGRIVAEVQHRLTYMIAEHHAHIETTVDWPVALGHGPWVEEVWANYIINGIKYGGQPPRIRLGATDTCGGMVRFWVRDNGDGVAPDFQDQLFQPFARLNQVSAEGYGLGLSIVRQIVEKLGGEVSVESKGTPGQGSIFSFTLKRAAPNPDD
ncbi:MAG: PAS domain S-box protein [Anaerolineae bacterium]|nr:PAS domain S-box protein [Anaerolineae bacterium]MCB9107961.1 PAS domain S-box protein [Anaerolineales bacterium]